MQASSSLTRHPDTHNGDFSLSHFFVFFLLRFTGKKMCLMHLTAGQRINLICKESPLFLFLCKCHTMKLVIRRTSVRSKRRERWGKPRIEWGNSQAMMSRRRISAFPFDGNKSGLSLSFVFGPPKILGYLSGFSLA